MKYRRLKLGSAEQLGLLLWAFATVLLIPGGCALVKDPQNEDGDLLDCETNFATNAFKATLYTLVQAKCVTCHGSFQVPLFAVGSANTAYNNMLPLVSFKTPGDSRIVKKSKDQHCGINCTTDGSDYLAAIQKWQSAEQAGSSCGQGSLVGSDTLGRDGVNSNPQVNPRTIIGPAIPLPNPMPTAFDPLRPLVYPLDSLGFPGARILIEYKRLSARSFDSSGVMLDPGSYVFRVPRLELPNNVVTYNMYIRDMAISINDKDHFYNEYPSIDQPVGPVPPTTPCNPPPAPTATNYISCQSKAPKLSTLGTRPILQEKASGDTLILSFSVLQKALAIACKNTAFFQQYVWGGPGNGPANTMKYPHVYSFGTGLCVACHNANHPRGFNLTDGTADQVCARAIQRISVSDPNNSVLIKNPLTGANGHPDIPGLSGRTLNFDKWKQWISSEQ